MRDEFLRLAQRAEELADAIKQPHARERMLIIAGQWREMAMKVDEASAHGAMAKTEL